MEKVNLAEKLARIAEPWSPRIVGELNRQHVKLAKLSGEFMWHRHVDEDELFLARDEAHVLLFEPAGTLNTGDVWNKPTGDVWNKPTGDVWNKPTGDVWNERTVDAPARI